jgi:hypothetical protein
MGAAINLLSAADAYQPRQQKSKKPDIVADAGPQWKLQQLRNAVGS